VRAQFLVEVAAAGGPAGTALESVTDLEELFGVVPAIGVFGGARAAIPSA